jgi:hypothetical protein
MATAHLGLHPSFAVIPLIFQSLTVGYAVVEYTMFRPFLRAAEADRPATQRVTRLWWTHFLSLGLTTIFSVTLPAIFSAIYAARKLPSDTLEWKLYAAGASFGSAHFLFASSIGSVINNICDEQNEKKGETLNYLRKWLQIHAVRSVVADIPALLCFGYLVFGL